MFCFVVVKGIGRERVSDASGRERKRRKKRRRKKEQEENRKKKKKTPTAKTVSAPPSSARVTSAPATVAASTLCAYPSLTVLPRSSSTVDAWKSGRVSEAPADQAETAPLAASYAPWTPNATSLTPEVAASSTFGWADSPTVALAVRCGRR